MVTWHGRAWPASMGRHRTGSFQTSCHCVHAARRQKQGSPTEQAWVADWNVDDSLFLVVDGDLSDLDGSLNNECKFVSFPNVEQQQEGKQCRWWCQVSIKNCFVAGSWLPWTRRSLAQSIFVCFKRDVFAVETLVSSSLCGGWSRQARTGRVAKERTVQWGEEKTDSKQKSSNTLRWVGRGDPK